MIKRLEKRGSHVEVIISFIIFVTFVIFLISIITPAITTQKEKENIFDSVERGILNRVYSNLTVISVKTNDSINMCINIGDVINNYEISEGIVVKNSAGQILNSNINSNSLQINKASLEDNFFRVYSSQEFVGLSSGVSCTSVISQIGLTKTRQYIFESKFLVLIDEDYNIVKSELKTPPGVEFGYGIILANGTTLETKNDEKVSTNVYIRDTPIEYVDLEGNILEGYIKTKIW